MSTILYVDDDRDNLLVFEAMCSERFKVLTAETGKEALELLAQEEVAVLLADQRMPGMTGVELAEQASRAHPDVVRILVTAYSDLGEAVDAINRGNIRGYIRKPWDQEELLAILKEALATYATRKKVRGLELHMMATERVYTLGVVTAGIAHELRSPLCSLSESSTVMLERLGETRERVQEGDCEKALELIDSMLPFLDALVSTTDSMVDTCRGFEVSNYQVDPSERCDLEEVVGTASRIVLASREGVENLHMDLKATGQIRGNRHRLGRVIINLLVNAFDAVEDRSTAQVHLRLFEEGDSVILEVQDNGPGVEPAKLSRIFDVFFSTKASGGTGLGLAMSRRIVEEVGGSLSCSSSPGEGALFRMSLPLVSEPQI